MPEFSQTDRKVPAQPEHGKKQATRANSRAVGSDECGLWKLRPSSVTLARLLDGSAPQAMAAPQCFQRAPQRPIRLNMPSGRRWTTKIGGCRALMLPIPKMLVNAGYFCECEGT